MRKRCHIFMSFALSAAVIVGLSACAATAPMKRPSAAVGEKETPMPTVPPSTPTPEVEAAPLPTRPIGKQVTARKGQAIGPIITYFGAAHADGTLAKPESVDKNGISTYRTIVGSGFMFVVEAKPGESGLEPGRQVFLHVPNDPASRPDLEIQANRDLGNGSPEVCDRRRPNIGGIPGINPPSFAEKQRISDALNDFSCRFETFIESESSCTMSASGDYAFASKDTMTQFCMLVARAYALPVGETVISVRVRDTEGNPGPVKQLRVIRPPEPQKPKPKKKLTVEGSKHP